MHQLDRIEAKLDQLIAPKATINIKDIEYMLKGIQNRSKIEAIKGLRAISGLPLKEAKDIIEKYWVAA